MSSKKSDVASSKPAKRSDQVINGRDVDPEKLIDTLDKRFGRGNYQGEMRHNRFFIRACHPLTEVKPPNPLFRSSLTILFLGGVQSIAAAYRNKKEIRDCAYGRGQ